MHRCSLYEVFAQPELLAFILFALLSGALDLGALPFFALAGVVMQGNDSDKDWVRKFFINALSLELKPEDIIYEPGIEKRLAGPKVKQIIANYSLSDEDIRSINAAREELGLEPLADREILRQFEELHIQLCALYGIGLESLPLAIIDDEVEEPVRVEKRPGSQQGGPSRGDKHLTAKERHRRERGIRPVSDPAQPLKREVSIEDRLLLDPAGFWRDSRITWPEKLACLRGVIKELGLGRALGATIPFLDDRQKQDLVTAIRGESIESSLHQLARVIQEEQTEIRRREEAARLEKEIEERITQLRADCQAAFHKGDYESVLKIFKEIESLLPEIGQELQTIKEEAVEALERQRGIEAEMAQRRAQIAPAKEEIQELNDAEINNIWEAFEKYLWQGDIGLRLARNELVNIQNMAREKRESPQVKQLKIALEKEIPERIAARYEEAGRLYGEERFEEAAAVLKVVLALRPNHKEAQESLNRINASLEEREIAAQLAKEEARRLEREKEKQTRLQVQREEEERLRRERKAKEANREQEPLLREQQKVQERQARIDKTLERLERREELNNEEETELLLGTITVNDKGMQLAGRPIQELLAEKMSPALLRIISLYAIRNNNRRVRQAIVQELIRVARGSPQGLKMIIVSLGENREILAALIQRNPEVFESLLEDESAGEDFEAHLLEIMLSVAEKDTSLFEAYIIKRKTYLIEAVKDEDKRNKILESLGEIRASGILRQLIEILSESKVYTQDGQSLFKVLEIKREPLQKRVFYQCLMDNPDILWEAVVISDLEQQGQLVDILVDLAGMAVERRSFIDGQTMDTATLDLALWNTFLPRIFEQLRPNGHLPKEYDAVNSFLHRLLHRSTNFEYQLLTQGIPSCFYLFSPIDDRTLAKIIFLRDLIPLYKGNRLTNEVKRLIRHERDFLAISFLNFYISLVIQHK